MKSNKINYIVLSMIMVGCTPAPVDKEKSEEILIPYVNGVKSNIIDEINTLSVDYEVEVKDIDGRFWKTHRMDFPDKYELVKLCPINLTKKDIENKASLRETLLKEDNYIIVNLKKKEDFKNCIKEKFMQMRLSNDDIGYFLADGRIKDNISVPLLRNEILKANSDKIITYGEIVNIYKTLDKVLVNKRQQQINDLADAKI